LTDFPKLDATCQTKEVADRLRELKTKVTQVHAEESQVAALEENRQASLQNLVHNKAPPTSYTDIVQEIFEYRHIQDAYAAYVKSLQNQILYYQGLKSCGDYNPDGSRRTGPPPVPEWPGPPVVPSGPPQKPLPLCRSKEADDEIAAIEGRIKQLKTLEGEIGQTWATHGLDADDGAKLAAIVAELAGLNDRLAKLKALPVCPPGGVATPLPARPAQPPVPAPTPPPPPPPAPPPRAAEVLPPSCPAPNPAPPPAGPKAPGAPEAPPAPKGAAEEPRIEIGERPDDGQPKTGQAFVQGPCPPPHGSALELGIVSELNLARSDPPAYVPKVLGKYTPAQTADAVAFLQHQPADRPLIWDDRLAQAARVQVTDQATRDPVGHIGADGSNPMQRIHTVGISASVTAEEISVGETTPVGAIRQLTTDIPGPRHPHRDDLFDDPTLEYVGVACGPNSHYGTICVIDMSSAPIGSGDGA
jgi:hypothetical protein